MKRFTGFLMNLITNPLGKLTQLVPWFSKITCLSFIIVNKQFWRLRQISRLNVVPKICGAARVHFLVRSQGITAAGKEVSSSWFCEIGGQLQILVLLEWRAFTDALFPAEIQAILFIVHPLKMSQMNAWRLWDILYMGLLTIGVIIINFFLHFGVNHKTLI